MTPRLHLVRHAQGLHNLCNDNTKIHDPDLTALGEHQCAELQKNFSHHQGVDLIFSSPIRRTLYTALLSFEDDIKSKNLTIVALPELQETSDLPCDTGSTPAHLASEFAKYHINFTHVQEGWNVKTGRWSAHEDAIKKRAQEAREWLSARPEKEIVVVTHGGLLHYLTADWDDKDKFPGIGWANTEYRSYTIDNTRPGSHLIETEESKHRRSIKPLDHNEVTQLRRTLSKKDAEKADQIGATTHADQHDGSAHADGKPTDEKDSHSKV